MSHRYRKGLCDIQWAKVQKSGEPNCKIGDMVLFHAGGFGVISQVSAYDARTGWPSSYATKPVKGKPQHPTRKMAWHYEGDFRVVAKSPLHEIEGI